MTQSPRGSACATRLKRVDGAVLAGSSALPGSATEAPLNLAGRSEIGSTKSKVPPLGGTTVGDAIHASRKIASCREPMQRSVEVKRTTGRRSRGLLVRTITLHDVTAIPMRVIILEGARPAPQSGLPPMDAKSAETGGTLRVENWL